MSKKQNIIIVYLIIGLIFGLYQWFFGPVASRGLIYNLGRGLVWPAVMFPALGQIIGAIIIVAVIAALVILK